MKHYYLKALTLLSCLLIGITTRAYDFAAQNSDGVTIYYNITKSPQSINGFSYPGNVSVTYAGYSDWKYTGKVIIPSKVSHFYKSYIVTGISYSAFSSCSDLTNVLIPSSVNKIYDGAFKGCSGLTSIVVESGNLKYDSRGNCNAIIETATNTLNAGCKNTTIPNSVTSIGSGAFEDCTSLTGVTIPSSVTNISYSAFSGCTGLTSVIVEEGNTIYDSRDNCNAIIESASNILIVGSKNTIIPNSVTSIGDSAFAGCSGLTSITIPNSATSIGERAFSGCSGLTSITIPNSVTSIGESAFYDCSGLTSVIFNAENCKTMGSSSSPVFNGCAKLSSVTIGENVKNIPSYAFYGCRGFTSVTIPNSVTSIGDSAFRGCSGLTNIIIPNSVTGIGSNAFIGCTGLCSIKRNATATTQTKLNFKITNNTEYEFFMEINNKTYKTKDNTMTFEIFELAPGKSHSYDYGLIINNNDCTIYSGSEYTKSLSQKLEIENGDFYLNAKGSYTEGDATILGTMLSFQKEPTEYDNLNEKTFYLDPNTNYTVYYSVNTKEGGVYSTSKTFTTGALTWNNAEYQATSTTSARLMTETNCDATEGTGFEWRRYGAPENLKPNAVACPVVDGMLIGSLRNLNSEAYYEFRPYYTSSSGKTYCGEWTALFTGDANVYFEPEVRTYEDVEVAANNATLKGYALAGTDEITSQGFEYWKSSNQPSAEAQLNAVLDCKTMTADGISMSALIENLDYGTTYCYRAFATTEKGTVYGDTMEFTTENEPSGIEETIVDGSEDAPVEYYNLQGVRVVNPERGLYIKRQGGKTTKVVL